MTEEKIQFRIRKRKRIESLGVSPAEYGKENPYRVEAMLYIYKDLEIPKEVLDKMVKYDKEHHIIVSYLR